MNRSPMVVSLLLFGLLGPGVAAAQAAPPVAAQAPAPRAARPPAEAQAPPAPAPKPQPRPHGVRVPVDVAKIEVDDGDSVVIRWGTGEAETVRILGIDTPETRHIPHDIPYAQPLGPEASAFLQGVLALASQVELLRASTLDQYGRTLGYVFVNGRNYSVLVVRARLAEETVTHFGDNGFPREAEEVMAAAKAAGPLAFEAPHQYRARMRALSAWMKERGIYPEQ